LEEAGGRTRFAVSRAARPVLEPRLDEFDADEEDGGTGDERGKDLFEDAWAGKGHGNLEEGAACGCAEDGPVAIGAGQFCAVSCGWTVSRCIHLGECASGNGNGGEGGSDDRDQARADVVWGPPDVAAGDLDRGQDAADYQ